jgi:hypothetical protein
MVLLQLSHALTPPSPSNLLTSGSGSLSLQDSHGSLLLPRTTLSAYGLEQVQHDGSIQHLGQAHHIPPSSFLAERVRQAEEVLMGSALVPTWGGLKDTALIPVFHQLPIFVEDECDVLR